MALEVNRLNIVVRGRLRCLLWIETHMIELIGKEDCHKAAGKTLHQRNVHLIVIVILKINKSAQTEREHALRRVCQGDFAESFLIEAVLERNKIDVQI